MAISIVPSIQRSVSMASSSFAHPNEPKHIIRKPRWTAVRCSARERANETNYYELLGVSADSNAQEIKEAYRKLQKKFHPDIAGQEGHERTLRLNEAYRVLMREDRRKEYDSSMGEMRVRFGNYNPGLGYSSWKGPLRSQALFVDGNACIGCRECVHHASNTFTMDETLGRARVKVQYGDNDQKIQVSVESCPVNCIYWVEKEELAVLEYLMQPLPKEGYGVFGGGWEIPANVFMAAKAFTQQPSNPCHLTRSLETTSFHPKFPTSIDSLIKSAFACSRTNFTFICNSSSMTQAVIHSISHNILPVQTEHLTFQYYQIQSFFPLIIYEPVSSLYWEKKSIPQAFHEDQEEQLLCTIFLGGPLLPQLLRKEYPTKFQPLLSIHLLKESFHQINCLTASYLLPMSTGEEEERAYDDAFGPLFNARFECVSYRRFSQLHGSRLHNRVTSFIPKHSNELIQHEVRFLPPGAMVDDNDCISRTNPISAPIRASIIDTRAESRGEISESQGPSDRNGRFLRCADCVCSSSNVAGRETSMAKRTAIRGRLSKL